MKNYSHSVAEYWQLVIKSRYAIYLGKYKYYDDLMDEAGIYYINFTFLEKSTIKTLAKKIK